MRFYKLVTLCTASLLIISGCATNSPSPEEESLVDTSLPVVKLTKNGVYKDINAIAFEWNSITDERVKGIYIYKQTMKDPDSKEEHFRTIDNRFVTHYVDSEVKPDTQYGYSFQTFSEKSQSPMSKKVYVTTLPILESVTWIQSINDLPRTAKIIWRPHTNKKVKAYIIERKTLEDANWKKIATVDGRLNAEYVDTDLKNNYLYKYRVRVLTYDNLTSAPSKVVQCVTKSIPFDVFSISASRDLPKRIEIKWQKSIAKDFAHYNLYRADTADGDFKLISNLTKNIYVDKIDEDGKQYFYRVSVVDKDGLESVFNKKSIQGITLVKPEAPVFIEAKLKDDKVFLSWKKGDPRVKQYIVTKRYRKTLFDEKNESFEGINKRKFVDKDLLPDTTYHYIVYGIDKYNVKSKPSVEVEIKTPKAIKDAISVKKDDIKVEKRPSSKNSTNNDDIVIPNNDF